MPTPHNKPIHGNCLCGSVSLSLPIENPIFEACHCGMCRTWSGGPALTVHGNSPATLGGQDCVSVYSSSAWAERAFCKRCGTHLYYKLKGSDFYTYPFGLFKNTEQFKFQKQIFIDKKPHNYSFAESTEKMTEAEVFAKHAPK